mmetsp:Transcript_88603/g.275678  ORF Transcript_88603/g.275678 Transcript_88603/m.275678 type:complete len:201 (-) Transcript_88603:33-635(-)
MGSPFALQARTLAYSPCNEGLKGATIQSLSGDATRGVARGASIQGRGVANGPWSAGGSSATLGPGPWTCPTEGGVRAGKDGQLRAEGVVGPAEVLCAGVPASPSASSPSPGDFAAPVPAAARAGARPETGASTPQWRASALLATPAFASRLLVRSVLPSAAPAPLAGAALWPLQPIVAQAQRHGPGPAGRAAAAARPAAD